MKTSNVLVLVAVLVAANFIARRALSDTFSFGGSRNHIDGSATASLTSDGFVMSLATLIPGTSLNETQGGGLGIDSRPLAGGNDATPALFNELGLGPLAGTREAAQFSFHRGGFLTGINFDGVKDESLEYFILRVCRRSAIEFL